MTSVEIPYSIACALPSLTVLDITNDVAHELERQTRGSGIAYVSPLDDASTVRVNERESGFFEDIADLLARLVPVDERERERIVRLLLGPRTEQIPFRDGRLCLGTWQRVMLFDFDGGAPGGWTLTVLGSRPSSRLPGCALRACGSTGRRGGRTIGLWKRRGGISASSPGSRSAS